MKNDDKNTKSSYLRYLNVNNLSGWTMSQKFPVTIFELTKDTSKSN